MFSDGPFSGIPIQEFLWGWFVSAFTLGNTVYRRYLRFFLFFFVDLEILNRVI
jgi:hypothetical protein